MHRNNSLQSHCYMLHTHDERVQQLAALVSLPESNKRCQGRLHKKGNVKKQTTDLQIKRRHKNLGMKSIYPVEP